MSDTGQVAASAAEVYEEFFLPALFAAWPPRLIEAAGVGPGMRVLDVACGTGVLARAAAEAVAPGGAVAGVDLNPGMLAVARQRAPEIEWHEGPAEALPLPSDAFDAALCQFGLMFFEDRAAALREMARVVRPGGRVAVAVWADLDQTPGYAAVVELLTRLFDAETADLLRSPYSMGDAAALEDLMSEAGLPSPKVQRVPGSAHFPSIRAWMHSDVRGWTLADRIDDAQFEHLVAEAEAELARFVGVDGSVRFDHPALVASAERE